MKLKVTAKEWDKIRRCRKCRIKIMRQYHPGPVELVDKESGKTFTTFPQQEVEEVYQKFGAL